MANNEEDQLAVVDYFATKANTLDAKASEAKIFDNRADIGDLKENILLSFLRDHLPKRCDIIRGGYIFNQLGNRSKQIDLIVTNDSTIQFKQTHGTLEGKSFNSIEGSLAAISVKSSLDKQQFLDAIDNLASILTTPRAFAPINRQGDPVVDDVLKEMLYKTPYKVIFAFRGMSVDAAVEHLKDYIRDKRPDDRTMPDFIIVNKSYYIYKVLAPSPVSTADGEQLPTGEELPTGSYRAVAYSNHIAGISLLRLISEIQMLSNFSSLAMITFNHYELAIQELLKNRQQTPLVRAINRTELLGIDEVDTPTTKSNEKNNNNDKTQT